MSEPGDGFGQSVRGYLDLVASDAPAPGGGSVAGVVAALAAALGEMVCRLSGEPDRATGARHLPDALREPLARLGAAREGALGLAAADEAAYAAYRRAAALPRASDEERRARTAAVQAALRTATEVPLALAGTCLAIVRDLQPVAEHGTRHAQSDTLAGAMLAEAAARAALLNVRGNAAMLRDGDEADRCLARADALEREISRDAEAIAAIVRHRTG